MGITSKLADDLSAIHALSSDDEEQIKILILDYMAAAFAGYKQNGYINNAVERVTFKNSEIEESYVFLQDKKYSAQTAAFMNAFYTHGAELDDGNKKAAGHVGVHVISAVFALADTLDVTNEEVFAAIATGYEAYIRISSAAQPGLVERSFHSTGVVGTIACAAACAKLLKLDARGIENAIALATTMTGGILSYGDSRPAIKPVNPGMAAKNGLFAALLANEGIEGPVEALEGPNGFFHAFTDMYDEKMLEKGERLLLHECYIKLYPSCRHTHCGIDAALNLAKKICYKDIKKINVYIYKNAIKLAGLKYPQNDDETKFSIYYTLTCAIYKGKYGIDDMDVSGGISDEIKDLIEKTELICDDSMENRQKGIRGAKVELELNDGSRVEEIVFVPKGDPENPLHKDEVIEKLRVCSDGKLSIASMNALVSKIFDMDRKCEFSNPLKGIEV